MIVTETERCVYRLVVSDEENRALSKLTLKFTDLRITNISSLLNLILQSVIDLTTTKQDEVSGGP